MAHIKKIFKKNQKHDEISLHTHEDGYMVQWLGISLRIQGTQVQLPGLEWSQLPQGN